MPEPSAAAPAPSPASTRPARPLIVGNDSGPSLPYPYRMAGQVISGFGRGSKELGIPTANIPVDASLTPWISDIPSGIYFGWASLVLPPDHADRPVSLPSGAPALYPMVMSVGYNPFYNNKTRSAEVHVLHAFAADFYGSSMRLLLLDFLRPERGDYAGLDDLVADIRFDCDVARRSLDRPAWSPAATAVAVNSDGAVGRADGTLDIQWLLEVEVEGFALVTAPTE